MVKGAREISPKNAPSRVSRAVPRPAVRPAPAPNPVQPALAEPDELDFADEPRGLPAWVRRELPAVGLVGLALLSAYSLISPVGWLGGSLYYVLSVAFGLGRYLFPLVLIALGVALVRQRLDPDYHLGRGEVAGWLGLYLCALTLLEWAGEAADPLAEPAGGALGRLVYGLLVGAIGSLGAGLTIALVAVIGLGLVLGVTPATVWRDARSGIEARLAARADRPALDAQADDELDAETTPEANPLRRFPRPLINRSSTEAISPDFGPRQGAWELPPVEMLREDAGGQLSQSEIDRKIEIIEQTLADFDVPVHVVEVNPGPTVTQYGVEPGFRERRDRNGQVVRREKIKVSEITALSNDLAMELAAANIRIEAPVPGREFVGIEVPNDQSTLVNLRRTITSPQFQRLRLKAKLAVALGEDVSGQAVAADLAKMPHLLIAGQTGAGKSVCVNAIISSLLLYTTPDEVRLLLVDPKRVELTGYNDVPHLLRSVVVEADKVVAVLRWAVQEMEERYKLYEKLGVRNIDGYHRLAETRSELNLKRMNYIVIVIDELADLMMLAADEVERQICRLAQLARATGIHLIVATQRPSVNVITGLIKANFPTRISFTVASQVDSRTILDAGGAEKLLGRGDMLYLPQEASKAVRIQGTFVSDDEVQAIVDWWKNQGAPSYVERLVKAESFVPGADDGPDELSEKAVELAHELKHVSVSLLQRRLKIGYARAARLLDQLEEDGIVVAAANGHSYDVVQPSSETSPTESASTPLGRPSAES